ncbi:hypothetical protein NMG60_11031978 [Bertholletia excelsa]
MPTIKNVLLLLLVVVLTTCSLADHHPADGPCRPSSVVEVKDGKKPPVGPKPPPIPEEIEVEADKHPDTQKPSRGPIIDKATTYTPKPSRGPIIDKATTYTPKPSRGPIIDKATTHTQGFEAEDGKKPAKGPKLPPSHRKV